MDSLKSEITLQTYFEANLAVMSQMQQDSSETLGFACEFANYNFFSVVLHLGRTCPLPVPTAMVMEVHIIELSKDRLTGRWSSKSILSNPTM